MNGSMELFFLLPADLAEDQHDQDDNQGHQEDTQHTHTHDGQGLGQGGGEKAEGGLLYRTDGGRQDDHHRKSGFGHEDGS